MHIGELCLCFFDSPLSLIHASHMTSEYVASLDDDGVRYELERLGYSAPPIADAVMSKILRRKLLRLIDPSAVIDDVRHYQNPLETSFRC
ncbi:unnamed protein product [Protopolystoma xenopodis]|uniref:Uncharacterized protein n=1 Tax=Protopolystoma xenopodis TaxID=117903 RepID=A0A448WTX2_9PLAT|nr:unnamed protein product [Protopolystoma xenopodis]